MIQVKRRAALYHDAEILITILLSRTRQPASAAMQNNHLSIGYRDFPASMLREPNLVSTPSFAAITNRHPVAGMNDNTSVDRSGQTVDSPESCAGSQPLGVPNVVWDSAVLSPATLCQRKLYVIEGRFTPDC